MNSFKAAWMRLNWIQFINLKMKSDFDKIKILRLYSNLLFIMNYRKNLKYCIINMKVDKACRATDDRMKKKYFLNKIWLKFRQNSSKFNFVLTILKTYKHEMILIISHFSEMFMCMKRVNCYFIVFFMLVISRSVVSFQELSFNWYFSVIWWVLIKFL